MMRKENKKIAVGLFISSVAVLATAFLIKEPLDMGTAIVYQSQHLKLPISEYGTTMFGIAISIKTTITTCILLIAISIYFMIYKTDDEIKSNLQKYYRKMQKVFSKNRLK